MPRVTVLSHLPHAVEAQLYKMELWPESTTERRAVRTGVPVTINGMQTPDAEIVDGCAVTRGVDGEFFAAWQEQNAGSAWAAMISAIDDAGDHV